eukprot:CAMPEP_0202960220 /NCGR_PEP_ID=MMETSP1396-20130829/4360_1 /ASSEMBLY_ACC=CAM_ASM_000872 /TAXON_ID= /ORGANISM="Pseudokeronopsis sp., Strain Brazil" /LENGTH=117 /DNA_ID=CAMNT_0049679285 /DNA_START=578 /DNA_END=930 /DNA_ORIENTATION=+
MFVVGPTLIRDENSSVLAIAKFLKGEIPGVPRLMSPVVDVRDVALAPLPSHAEGWPPWGADNSVLVESVVEGDRCDNDGGVRSVRLQDLREGIRVLAIQTGLILPIPNQLHTPATGP